MRHRIKRIHFVGIGGTGMCGIAEVMHNLDYTVTGSDIGTGPAIDRLRDLGVTVHAHHDAAHVGAADAVVTSSAIGDANPEVVAARAAKLPVVPRVKMLNELLRLRLGIAIAGSHGKTTITSMVAHVLAEAGLNPTYVVGGVVRRSGTNAALGTGNFIVVESDESDGSFLHLSPVIAVASNIDSDHLQAYGQDLRGLKRAFVEFFENLPFYGVAVICADDPQLRDVAGLISCRVISYGLEAAEADFRATAVEVRGDRTDFRLAAPYGERDVRLHAIGRHNVANALSALAVAHEINVAPDAAIAALATFEGVGRRLEHMGAIAHDGHQALLVDDYGHHPTEIAASLDALRCAHPDRRLVLVFQPHRYSRTRDLFDALARALATADMLLVCDVYAAGEEPLAAATGEALANAIRLLGNQNVLFVNDLDDVPGLLAANMLAGDLVVTMGAGSITGVARRLAREWAA